MLSTVLNESIPKKMLERILKSGRIAQAYLFKGPEGCGKKALAHEFAQAILCEKRKPEGGSLAPCGECWSCKAFSSESHPDFFYVQKDGASIKIKTSFDIVREALTTPYRSKRKIFLIPEAQDMTLEAANALLKIIEEPPDYVTFILTSSNVKGIPDTIISRCQVIPFPALSARDLTEILVSDYGLSREQAELWGNYSQGNLEKAKTLISWVKQFGEGQRDLDVSRVLDESRRIVMDILSSSPIELAFKYSRTDPDERRTMLLVLETGLWEDLKKSIYQAGESVRENSLERGISTMLYSSVVVVEKAKMRLKSNVNVFLTMSNMFLDLKRILSTHRSFWESREKGSIWL